MEDLKENMKTPEWGILLKNNINDEHIVDLDSRVSVRCALSAMREIQTQQIIEKNVTLFKELKRDSELDMFFEKNRVEIHFDASQQYLCYINYKDGDGAYGLGLTFLEALNNGFDKFNSVSAGNDR